MSASAFNPPLPGPKSAHHPAVYNAPATAHSSGAPAGTFVPGTKVQVGNHRVVIEKYLSEGGFAHVYLVRLPKPIDGWDVAVLKRVAVPDKEALANMRTEVETMKKLKGHRHIVTYMDSHASQLKGGGYEVFLLMEYCDGGGLIDFMNTRLQHRLTEPEILHIFSDVAEGVACMHYLKPPLLHRDLKVENVLISNGPSRRYKLCDFGSAAPPRPAATTATEGRLIEDDIQKHTTLQYRSPEMIDVYRKQPIDEKSDVWALGVLLYKLCYYTTPFEEQGQMAILNASFRFPAYPSFSDRLKKLIASMLREHPQLRPNIYQIVREVCLMRGTDVPIKDIYAGRSHSEARKNQQLPSPEPKIASPPIVGAYHAPPEPPKQIIPEIAPMRRGRPTKVPQQPPGSKPSPSPLRGATKDPFAALDSNSASTRAAAADELAARFPSLDQFSLLHDSGNKFEFDPTSPVTPSAPKDISQRVTEALADEAFALPKVQPTVTARGLSSHVKSTSIAARPEPLKQSQPAEQRAEQVRQSPLLHQPTPRRPVMVSTGTMTSPTSPPPEWKGSNSGTQKPVRLPVTSTTTTEHRSSSQPRASDNTRLSIPPSKPDNKRPPLLDMHRSKSQTLALIGAPQSPASSRPSLEGQRPSSLEINNSINRSRSANSRPRPSSVYLESNLDYLRDRESARGRGPLAWEGSEGPEDQEDNAITSNVDFLRSMEDDDSSRRKEKRSSSRSKHAKRSSIPAMALSNTKTILAGKFGDAFRRFEENRSGSGNRTPSPRPDWERNNLTPITGSEATGERSDDEIAVEDAAEIPAEVRRELERRRLSQEEKRVAKAKSEYRKKLAQDDITRGGPATAGVNRAASIQNRVKNLLDENKVSPSKTADGYGRFTESERKLPPPQFERPSSSSYHSNAKPELRPPTDSGIERGPIEKPYLKGRAPHNDVISAPPSQRVVHRPSAPPKPKALQTHGPVDIPQQHPSSRSPYLGARQPVPQPRNEANTSANGDDWEASFSKRYPSLSGLEMVETEIKETGPGGIRIKDV
ncbi:MAG: hypothetical protein M1819_003862 [Sarea resinae]|nr:MAG: hypothetical protein M1819_003862 [Sarea resinae]